MDPKSLTCVFIGYNEKYKGYRCYYPPTGRVFISRHILFDESVYPFEDMYSQYHKPSDSALLNAWRSSSLRKQGSPVSTDPIEEVFPPQRSNVIHIGTIPLVIPSTGTVNNAQHQDVDGNSSQETESDSSSTDSNPEVNQEVIPLQQPAHSMITRARAGIVKPNPRYALFTVKSDYSELKSLKAALRDPRWNGSMGTEIGTMHETETWDLVPPHEGHNPVNCSWVHKVKLNPDGSVNKLK